MHSDHHAALQKHSVGETYPWTIRGKGNTLQGFHCLTAEEGPRFRYYSAEYIEQNPACHLQSFGDAHKRAELWVEKQINAEREV